MVKECNSNHEILLDWFVYVVDSFFFAFQKKGKNESPIYGSKCIFQLMSIFFILPLKKTVVNNASAQLENEPKKKECTISRIITFTDTKDKDGELFFIFTYLFHFCSFSYSLLWSTGLKWVDYVTIWKKYQFIMPCSAFRRKYVKGDKIYYPTYALSTTMNSVLDLFPNKE